MYECIPRDVANILTLYYIHYVLHLTGVTSVETAT